VKKDLSPVFPEAQLNLSSSQERVLGGQILVNAVIGKVDFQDTGNPTHQELVEQLGSGTIVPMLKPRKTILRFAGVGLAASAILGICADYGLIHTFSKGMEVGFDVAYFVLCPPHFLIWFCLFDGCEKNGWYSAAMYAGFGLLNAALYALAGKIWISWGFR
jgi:hypothetical protein